MRLGWLAALLGGCVVVEHDEVLPERVFDASIRAVVADVGAGDLTVEVGGTEDAVLARELRWTGEAPAAEVWMEGDVLRIDVQCRFLQRVCEVDHHLVLPEPATLEASLLSGDLLATGVEGRVAVDVGSGSVTLIDVGGDVTVGAGSGDVDIAGITGELAVDVGSGGVTVDEANVARLAVNGGSGDVALHLVEQALEVDVDNGSGDVRLEVPAGRYRVEADTGSGDLVIDGITADRAAEHRLRVDTGSGNVRIIGR